MEKTLLDKRLYLITVVGKGIAALIEDLDSFNENFFKDYEEEYVQYGNSIYFVSEKDTDSLSSDIDKKMNEDFGFILLDITDSLNIFDFRGHVTKEHEHSKKFVNLIKRFIEKEETLTDEEKLKQAVFAEEYEMAAKIRDRIQKCNEV